MALLMKNGIAYAKSDKIYTRVFEKELLGGQSTVIFTDELIVPDSTVKFYSSDKDMVLISKKITGHTLKAVVYSTKITHNVKVEISTPHSSINPICYGYRMNNSVNNPDNCITYLEDAEGMTPAAMNFSTGVFNYGSWENAFFMPKPCMLNYDGTVAYYLDKNDYSKKEDGTLSDVANLNFPGNAMMEWGQNGQKIWYKIVPDDSSNGKSANIYIANMKLDNHFKAWSFIDYNGHLIDHFYTGVYQGVPDTNDKIRSLSGMDLAGYYNNTEPGDIGEKTIEEVVASCEANNVLNSKAWYNEQFCDNILITLLCVLIFKSNDIQGKLGIGNVYDNGGAACLSPTGALNDKGLFYGSSSKHTNVKVFGMEDWYGNGWNACGGVLIMNEKFYYKLTRSTIDGSSVIDYNYSDITGYLEGPNIATPSQYGGCCITEETYNRYTFFPTKNALEAWTNKYAGDYCYSYASGETCPNGFLRLRGSWWDGRDCGLFTIQPTENIESQSSGGGWNTGFLSCKPERK